MWKDCETEIDYLDFDYFIELLKNIINNDNLLPASVGVYGDWGSGKSSLIKMAINSFSEKNEENIVCLNFNSWLFEDYDDAKTSLIASVLDEIRNNRNASRKATIVINSLYKSIDKVKLLKSTARFGADLAISGGLLTITKLLLNPLENIEQTNSSFDKFKKKLEDELNHNDLRDDIKKFRENFDILLKETKIDKLIIFIDELDRCNPETILETLEAIRLFLFTGKTVFIIGADERQISNAIRNKYSDIKGTGIDIGKEYLEKLIQYPIKLPPLNSNEVEIYITCLLMQNELVKEDFLKVIEYIRKSKKEKFLEFEFKYTDKLGTKFELEINNKIKESIALSKQISGILAKGLNGNPRQCKRFLNTLVMREKMADFKNCKLDRKILSKLMLLEYFRPQKFEDIYEKITADKNYFKKLENKKNDIKEEKRDEWFDNWINILPKLENENLYPYFYFSRESLNKNISNITLQISQKGKEILATLLNESEFIRNKGIEEFRNLPDYDKQNIVNTIYKEIMADTRIKHHVLESLISIACDNQELQLLIIEYLQTIPIANIKASHAPLIGNLKDKIQNSVELEKFINSLNPKVIDIINDKR